MLAADDLPVTDGPRSNASDEKGGQCPADRAIMSRTRVELGGGRNALHLERCGSCHGIWFDAGEWKALADSHLLDHLDDFWTAEWRTRQRREHEHDAYDARMKQLFGEELYGQLVATGHALRGHPRRSQALAIIREQSE
jgi:Zn-finger nucleic acid-binding protein